MTRQSQQKHRNRIQNGFPKYLQRNVQQPSQNKIQSRRGIYDVYNRIIFSMRRIYSTKFQDGKEYSLQLFFCRALNKSHHF